MKDNLIHKSCFNCVSFQQGENFFTCSEMENEEYHQRMITNPELIPCDNSDKVDTEPQNFFDICLKCEYYEEAKSGDKRFLCHQNPDKTKVFPSIIDRPFCIYHLIQDKNLDSNSIHTIKNYIKSRDIAKNKLAEIRKILQ